jgi:uncharacterized protein
MRLLPALLVACLASSIAHAESNYARVSSPSFDCAKATRPDEVVICANPELSRLDQAANSGYEFLRRIYGRERANALTLPFLRERQVCRSDVACIRTKQLATIEYFQSLGAPKGIIPEVVQIPQQVPVSGPQPAQPPQAAATPQQDEVINTTGFALYVGDSRHCPPYLLNDDAVVALWRATELNPDKFLDNGRFVSRGCGAFDVISEKFCKAYDRGISAYVLAKGRERYDIKVNGREDFCRKAIEDFGPGGKIHPDLLKKWISP